jgi:6-pyruvoyltetrahydropterin/6-carboxytetrahydropterin synthase
VPYGSVKTYEPSKGLSCAFRQWRADHSHCSYLHGYSLGVSLHFEASNLNAYNWVIDFGGMDGIWEQLKASFDHATVIAKDDPEMAWFKEAAKRNIIRLVVLDHVGCEMFAHRIYQIGANWLDEMFRNKNTGGNAWLTKVKVFEHNGNMAYYTPYEVQRYVTR